MRLPEINLTSVLQEVHFLETRVAQPAQLAAAPTEVMDMQFAHERLGQFRFQHLLAPDLHVSFVEWQVPGENFELQGDEEAADINLSFQVGGRLFSRFAGIDHPLDMQQGRHNLIYPPEPGERHLVRAGDHLQVCHLSLTPATFRRYLDENEAWAQPFLEKLERKEPFSASPAPLSITPAMLQAIADLKRCSLTGHTRRLFWRPRPPSCSPKG